MQNLIPRILHDKIGKLQLQYKYNMAGSILRGLTWFVIDGEASKMGLRQGPALAGPVGRAALQAHAGAAVLHDLRGRSGNPGKVLVLVAKEAFLNTLLSACSPLYELFAKTWPNCQLIFHQIIVRYSRKFHKLNFGEKKHVKTSQRLSKLTWSNVCPFCNCNESIFLKLLLVRLT